MSWQTGKPPNEKIVEVEDAGDIIRVRAVWGRDGMRPHWESEDRDTLWSPDAFARWREVSPQRPWPMEKRMKIVDPRVDPALVPDGSRAIVIAEHQDEYRDLPSIRTPNGYVITRWELSDLERAAIVRGEDIYITLLSHGSINPLFATVGPVDWRTDHGGEGA